MDPQMTNPFPGYHFEERVQKEQARQKKNKISFILVLLLAVIVLFMFFNNVEKEQKYLSWVKSVVSNIGFLKAGVTLNLSSSKESGIDFSQINFDSLVSEETSLETEDDFLGQAEISQEPEMIVKPKKITLEEIEQEINTIIIKTNMIGQEIDKLVFLIEIQENIRKIAIQANNLSQALEGIDELV